VTYREMFEAELAKYNVAWCQGGCGSRMGHKRGFSEYGYRRIVHLDSQITTRGALMRGLHEIGHAVLHQYRKSGRRRYVMEAQAEAFAVERLRALGVAVPRKAAKQGRQYVARFKRFGDRVSAGLKARAKER
jgi:hypothetical protein